MRKLILAFALIATISAYHVDFDVVIDSVEYSNVPPKYILGEKFVFPEGAFAPSVDVLNEIIAQPRSGIEANVNEYADKIFANLQSLFVHDGLDPMELPDQHTGFNYTLIITYHGELDLTTGWLSDISSMHRGGDVIVAYSSDAKHLEVTIPIAFDDLQFTYDYSAKIMGLGPTGSVSGKIANIGITVELGFDAGNLVASLDTFQITNSGHINIEFHGNALVDWLINLLDDVVTTLLKPLILAIVEGIIRGGLTDVVNAINDAVDGILNPTTPAPVVTPSGLLVNQF